MAGEQDYELNEQVGPGGLIRQWQGGSGVKAHPAPGVPADTDGLQCNHSTTVLPVAQCTLHRLIPVLTI